MTAAVAGPLSLRVTVADDWKTYGFEAALGETAVALKQRALAAARIDPARAGDYQLKIGGALVKDESKPVGALGLADGAALVVLARRRRPVR